MIEDSAYKRVDATVVATALSRLRCPASSTFREFYERHAGPFAGSVGYELLDLVDQRENIASQTEAARTAHAFPDRYLVISNYIGNAVLVYDCATDWVFEVDFEGGEQALVNGTLVPRWRSFEAFLLEFFAA